ncbi:MULE transposase domain-containing protein [Hirsutella rhossiliensis]|uniref:MULE transposase domain-containing protein n=1 Tax=Hirsutella rhossiliensis TaxID=111463 RepID=A0A9P8MPE4_9HYPO|nr:MULE transposase domain-containing protein [Hirsutella rhossiliensis]KAH0958997.1 MULE transposase domain-containing protein [Hirsutella rhossiliensis]
MTTLDDLWHITVMCPEHNHGPEDPIAFPEHRKLTQAQIDEVELLSRDAAQTARTIHISLSVRNEGILTTEKDVTNLQTRRQMRELGARTSTQALVAKLDDIRIPHAETYNDEHLEKIVFLLDEGFEFWTRHSHLMMLDVTYNTNRFGLKLLEVNGITLSGSIFPLVACLSPDENGGIFEWALGQWKIWITEYALSLDLNDDAFYPHVVITDFDAAERWGIDRVFPLVQKQLCTWHIEKNIKKAARERWVGEMAAREADPMNIGILVDGDRGVRAQRTPDDFVKAWKGLRDADTEAEFLVLWQALQNDFSRSLHALEHPVRPKPNETPLLHAWLPLKLYKCSKQQPQHHRVSSRYLTTLRYSSQPNRYSRYVNLTAFDRTQHRYREMPRFFTSQLATQGVSIQQAIQDLQQSSQPLPPPPPLPQIITPLMTPLMTPLLHRMMYREPHRIWHKVTLDFKAATAGQIQRQAKPRVTRRQASRKRPYEQIIQF